MTYLPVRTAAPAIQPVSLDEVKEWADITYYDKDAMIEGLIAAATSRYDGPTGILGICLVEQSWRQDYDAFSRCMRLPFGPAISITGITYIDEFGDTQTVSAGHYSLLADSLGPYVKFRDTYSFASLSDVPAAVSITFKSGYANAGSPENPRSTVPDGIKQMLLLLIRHWFDNPAGVVTGTIATQMPLSVRSLEEQWSRIRV
jgi:uncharacterized phiE125 gp8 family phage protein